MNPFSSLAETFEKLPLSPLAGEMPKAGGLPISWLIWSLSADPPSVTP